MFGTASSISKEETLIYPTIDMYISEENEEEFRKAKNAHGPEDSETAKPTESPKMDDSKVVPDLITEDNKGVENTDTPKEEEKPKKKTKLERDIEKQKEELEILHGDGFTFRAKLIGIDSVDQVRGNELCHNSMSKLKEAVIINRQHKTRILLTVNWDKISVVEELDKKPLHDLCLSSVSYVWKDPLDNRAVGVISVSTGTDPNQKSPHFYAYKTEKQAILFIQRLKMVFNVKEGNSTSSGTSTETIEATELTESSPTSKETVAENDLVNFEDEPVCSATESLIEIFKTQPALNIPVPVSTSFDENISFSDTSIKIMTDDVISPTDQSNTSHVQHTDQWNQPNATQSQSLSGLLFSTNPQSTSPVQNSAGFPNQLNQLNLQQLYAINAPITKQSGLSKSLFPGAAMSQQGNQQTMFPNQAQQSLAAPLFQGYDQTHPINTNYATAGLQGQTYQSTFNSLSPQRVSWDAPASLFPQSSEVVAPNMPQTKPQSAIPEVIITSTTSQSTNPFMQTQVPLAPSKVEHHSDRLFADLISKSGLSGAHRFPEKNIEITEERRHSKPSLTELAIRKQKDSGLTEHDLSFLEGIAYRL